MPNLKLTKKSLFFLSLPDDVDAEADEVLNELNLLTEGENANITENRNQQDNSDWEKGRKL